MDIHVTCHPTRTYYILTIALAWCGFRLLLNFFLPGHLKTAHEQWKWKNNLIALIFTVIMSIWCPLALMHSSREVGQDNTLTRISCSCYPVLYFAWTNYVLEFVDLITHMKTSHHFRLAVHHVAAVAALSVGVLWKSNVCFLVAVELLETSSVLLYLTRHLAMSGFQRNGQVYLSLVKLRNVAFVGIRCLLFLWFQWHLYHNREDIDNTTFYTLQTACLVIAAHNMVLANNLLHNAQKLKKK